MSRASRVHPVRSLALIAVVVLVAAGCGSRRTYDELRAGEAEVAPSGAVQVAGATAPPSVIAPVDGRPAEDLSTTTSIATQPGASGSGPGSAPTGPARGRAASGPTQSPPGSAAAEASRPCTGTKAPIVLGSVGTQSGVLGAVFRPAVLAVQAWAAWVNSRGGIHCHPVKYLLADDGGDPARHQALVRQMVEQNKVVAFLQMNAPLTGQASVAYLSAKQIPVIGNEGGSNWFYESPTYFPASASGDLVLEAEIVITADTAERAGMSRLGVLSCIEAALCSRLNDVAPGIVARYGRQIVYRAQASLVQPDYTAACRAAKDAGVDVLFMGLDGNSIQRFARSCRSVDFHPVLVAQLLSLTPQLQGDANVDGLVGALTVAPWMLTGNPAVAEHQRVLTQYAPGLVPNGASMQGWVSAKLFEAAVADAPDPTTSAAILEAMWSVKGNDLGGLTYPITFVRGQNATKQYCVWPAQLRDGTYTSPGLDSRKCATL